MVLREVSPSCYSLAEILTFKGSTVTLAHHPYWWSFHTFACSTCELLEGGGLFAGIPLTALSSRSFCRGAKFDIVAFTSDTDEGNPLTINQASRQAFILNLTHTEYVFTSCKTTYRSSITSGPSSQPSYCGKREHTLNIGDNIPRLIRMKGKIGTGDSSLGDSTASGFYTSSESNDKKKKKRGNRSKPGGQTAKQTTQATKANPIR